MECAHVRIRRPLPRFRGGPYGRRPWSRFSKPPYDPGRSDFPSPVLTLAFLRGPFQRRRGSSAGPHTPRTPSVYPRARPCCGGRLAPALRPGTTPGPPSAQSPFARPRRYLCRDGVPRRLERRYPLFLAPTGSCARPHPSRRLRSPPWPTGPGRLLPAPAGRRSFPTLSPRIFPQVPGPLPRRSPWCSCPFLPTELRPSPCCNWVGTTPSPTQRLPCGTLFRGCSHSFTFKPPGLLATPGRSHRGSCFHAAAAVASTSERNTGRCLPVHRIC